MKRMTVLSAGGEFQHDAHIEEEEKPKKKKGKGKKKSKEEEPEEEPLIINRKTLHEAYYFLKETYVDKLEAKNEQADEDGTKDGSMNVQKVSNLKLKVEKIPSRQRRKSLNNNLALKSPNLGQRRKSLNRVE